MRNEKPSFESDYNNGAVPQILQRLAETNDVRTSGYGFDSYTINAKEKIRRLCGLDKADVRFLIGGTQANATVIDMLLQGCMGVICAPSAHIFNLEAGAVESYGHKVLPMPGNDTKVSAAAVDEYMQRFFESETWQHMVQPGMVYITFPTEMGELYSRKEIAELYDVCKKYNLYLYVDGARLGYGLAADGNDVDLPFLAHHCDVFYIGGTKVGALFGEAVVFANTPGSKYIFTTIKHHGALLAKGRLLGLQFDTLFTDDLYFKISRHAIDEAMKLRALFAKYGLRQLELSPTNQQFVVLTKEQKDELIDKVLFEEWNPLDDGTYLCRFVTSWATTDEEVDALDKALAEICLPKE